MGIIKKTRTISSLIAARDWGGIALRFAKYGLMHFVPSRIIAAPEAAPQASITKKQFNEEAKRKFSEFLFRDGRLVFPKIEHPKVAIILILYNKAELTYLCLESLIANCNEAAAELIIIDNMSTDATDELLNRIEHCRIVKNKENIGFLRACNQAASLVRAKNILFLNNDTIVHTGSLQQALLTLESDASIGAVGARIILTDGSLQEAGNVMWNDGTCHSYGRGCHPEAGEFMFQRPTDYCSGAFLLTRTKIFQDMGGFDAQFAPAYYEETDYCLTLQQRGFKIIYEPRASITHFEFGSSELSTFAVDMMNQNRRKLTAKHSSFLKEKPLPSKANFSNRSPQELLRPKLLYIDDAPPSSCLGAGFPRSLEILKILSQHYDITIFPTVSADLGWHEIYREIPRNIEIIKNAVLPKLRPFLKDRKGFYQTIWISRPHNMAFLVDYCLPFIDRNAIKIVYDAEAVFEERTTLERDILGKASKPLYKSKKFTEKQLANHADIVSAVSRKDLLTIRSSGPGFVIGHDLENHFTTKTFEDRSDIVFLGSIHGHPTPNSDALFWFLDEVMPQIKKQRPESKLHVVGFNRLKDEKVFAPYRSQVEFHGRVKDLHQCLDQFRLMVIPTRYAAGIPQKAYDACAIGLPCVVTDLIREQMSWQDGVHCLSAPVNDSIKFAEQCILGLKNREIWQKLRHGLENFITESKHHSIGQQTTHLVESLKSLRN